MRPAVDVAPPPARVLIACVYLGILNNKKQRGEAQGCKWKRLPFYVSKRREGPWDRNGEKIRYLAGSTNTALPSDTDVRH